MEITSTQRKPLVTFESVAAAAESLTAGGQRPSVRSIIAVLGGGSPNAVLRQFHAWKAARPSIKAAEVTIDPRIAAILAEQITATVADATRAAEARASDLEADAETVAEAGSQAEARAEELASELVRVQTENQQLTGRLDALTHEIEQLKKESAAAIGEARTDAQRERDAAELARQALARAELRLESMPALEAQLAELRTNLETERSNRTSAEKFAAVTQAEKQSAERLAEDYRARLVIADQRESQSRIEQAERQTAHERTFEKLAGSVGVLLEAKKSDAVTVPMLPESEKTTISPSPTKKASK